MSAAAKPAPQPELGLGLSAMPTTAPHAPSRAAGYDTSASAAAAVTCTLAQTRRIVLRAFLQHGPRTADEIAAWLNASVLAIRPRVTELQQGGLLERTGARRTNTSGASAAVWRITDAGKREAATP